MPVAEWGFQHWHGAGGGAASTSGLEIDAVGWSEMKVGVVVWWAATGREGREGRVDVGDWETRGSFLKVESTNIGFLIHFEKKYMN